MSTSSDASRKHGDTSSSGGISPRNDSSRSARSDASTGASRDATGSRSAESSTSSGLEASAAQRAVAGMHDSVGNGVISASLAGGDVGGMGPVVADGLTAAVGGVDSPDLMGSNTAMADLMRDAAEEEGLDMETASRAISASSGRPLAPEHQERFGRAFEHDFGHVRVHTSGTAAMAAQELNAHAFALGAEVFFGAGEFAPGTASGDRLLAHELTHVVQHDEGRLPGGGGVSKPTDPHEVEAYANEGVIVNELARVDQELVAEQRGELSVDADEDRVSDTRSGLELVDEFLGGAAEEVQSFEIDVETETETETETQAVAEAPETTVGPVDSEPAEETGELGADPMAFDAGGGFAAADPGPAGDPAGAADPGGPPDAGGTDSVALSALSRRTTSSGGGATAAPAPRTRRQVPTAVARRVRFALGQVEAELDTDQAEALTELPALGITATDGELAQDEQETIYERLDEVGALVGEPAGPDLLDQGGVTDTDPERHALTLQLLARLGATLGLSGVRVRVDEQSTARVRSLGTRGVMENGEVLLDADAYDPSTVDGQALLAHEVMHVAQDQLAPTQVMSDASANMDAGMLVEGEAQTFADAFVAGHATPDAAMAMPAEHSAQEGNPAAELKSLYATFDENLKTKNDAAKAKAEATAPPSKGEKPDIEEDREAKMDAYEDGLEEIADAIEDWDAFEELGDALDDEESKERDDAMSTIRGREKYDQMKKQWTAAKNSETDSGRMKKEWEDKFYDRGWGDDELAWNYVARKAKAEATEDELAAQAKGDLEEAKNAEDPEDPTKEEGEGTEAGEGGSGAGGAGGEAGAEGRTAEEVQKEFPETPNFELAYENKSTVAPLVNEQWTHYDQHTGEIQKAAEGGFASRGAVILGEVGPRMLGGAAKGFIGGLQDGAMDTVTDFGDKALTGLSKGKLPPGGNYVGSAVSLYQSGLLTGDFQKFGDTQKQAIDKIGKSASSGMEMWEKAGEASGMDAFGLYCASIADWLQAAIDTIDMVANLLGTLSAICFVAGGVLILAGMALLWLAGVGAPMITAGTWLVRAGKTLNKVKDVLDKINDILKPIRTVLRVIAAFTVPADVFADQVAALGDSAEEYGESKGKAVASTTVQEVKDHAAKKKEPKTDETEAPEGKTTGDGEAGADGDLSKKKKEVEDDIAELEKGKELLDKAKKDSEEAEANESKDKKKTKEEDDDATSGNKKPEDQEDGGDGKKSRDDIIKEGKPEDPTSLGGKLKKNVKEATFKDGLNPVKIMKGKWTALTTSVKSAKDDLKSYKEGSELKQYEMLLQHNEADQLQIMESLKQGKLVTKKIKGTHDAERAKKAKEQLDAKKQKLEGELKKTEIEARNKLNHLEQMKAKKDKVGDLDPADKKKLADAEAEFKKVQAELEAADKTYKETLDLEKKIANAEHRYRDTQEQRDQLEKDLEDAKANLPGQKEQLEKDKEAQEKATNDYEKAKLKHDKLKAKIEAKEAVVELRGGQVFFKPERGKGKNKRRKGKDVAGTVLHVNDGELVVQTSEGVKTVPFSAVNGPNNMEAAVRKVEDAETGPYGLKPQDISDQGLGTDIKVGKSELAEEQKKLEALKEEMETAKTKVSEGQETVEKNDALVNGPNPKPQDDRSTWQQVFSKDNKGIDVKETKSLLGLLSSGIKWFEGLPATDEEAEKKKQADEAKKEAAKTETKEDKANKAVEQLKKSDEDRKKEKDAADDKKGPFTKANDWWGGLGKNAADGIVHNLSGPRISELVSKKPPNDMDDMADVYTEAEDEAALFAEKHMMAFEAFKAEQVAKDEITMQEFLIETGEQQLKPATEQQGAAIDEGKAQAEERDAKVAGVDFGTEKSDSGIGGFISGLIMRLMDNDDYVNGDGEGSEEMSENATNAQDNVDEDAKKNQEEMTAGSTDAVNIVDQEKSANEGVKSLIDSDISEVQSKKEFDEGMLGEIQQMKATYLEERDQHKAKMEGKSVEYNEMMNGMAIWAAEYETKRDAWGESA